MEVQGTQEEICLKIGQAEGKYKAFLDILTCPHLANYFYFTLVFHQTYRLTCLSSLEGAFPHFCIRPSNLSSFLCALHFISLICLVISINFPCSLLHFQLPCLCSLLASNRFQNNNKTAKSPLLHHSVIQLLFRANFIEIFYESQSSSLNFLLLYPPILLLCITYINLIL